MLRWIGGIAAALVLAAIVALNVSKVGRIYLPSGTGMTAKQLCSMVFVSGLEADYARSIYLDPLMGEAAGFINADIDYDRQTVSTNIFGLFYRQHAAYRDGLGCTLVHRRGQFDSDLALLPRQDFQPLELNTAHRDAHFDAAALEAAVLGGFDDPEADRRNTLGVAVLHQGRLVAEHYAPGASRETPFLGWSMTKSITATLAGALEQDGRIDITAQNAVPALAPEGHGDITLEHLLRMTGGLAIHEENNGMDPNSQQLFTASDMARFSATRRQFAEPGEHWEYMSGQTNLAMHALQAELGTSLMDQLAAVRAEIFEPIGVYSAIIEPDEAGTLVGSSYMYATAHDWARLAQLYLDDGVWEGERILPEGWVERVTTPTDGSDGAYGIGFWLATEGDNLPEGTYFMNGFQIQLAMVLPEQELVIVRFGATNNMGAGAFDMTRAIVASMRN